MNDQLLMFEFDTMDRNIDAKGMDRLETRLTKANRRLPTWTDLNIKVTELSDTLAITSLSNSHRHIALSKHITLLLKLVGESIITTSGPVTNDDGLSRKID